MPGLRNAPWTTAITVAPPGVACATAAAGGGGGGVHAAGWSGMAAALPCGEKSPLSSGPSSSSLASGSSVGATRRPHSGGKLRAAVTSAAGHVAAAVAASPSSPSAGPRGAALAARGSERATRKADSSSGSDGELLRLRLPPLGVVAGDAPPPPPFENGAGGEAPRPQPGPGHVKKGTASGFSPAADACNDAASRTTPGVAIAAAAGGGGGGNGQKCVGYGGGGNRDGSNGKTGGGAAAPMLPQPGITGSASGGGTAIGSK